MMLVTMTLMEREEFIVSWLMVQESRGAQWRAARPRRG
ncbi:hypothetical protein E2C01_088618 [Portunus trituberculatus]|uniref:Uncharacterized protein n=1 Tax=Portunus trituberculatus TaxID=210409 RepID=A0A5B7J9S3_PORTR|nr:hypothetical protein [Portunus trituberculatus]